MSIIAIDPTSPLTLEKAEAMLHGIDGALDKAIKSAMQRATSHVRTNASKAVRERYAIKSGKVKEASAPKIDYSNDIFDGFSATILWQGTKIALSQFDGATVIEAWDTSRRVGVTKVKNGQEKTIWVHPGKPAAGHVLNSTGPQTLDNTFVAHFDTGHAGIYERTGGKTRTGNDKLLEKMGLSVPQMLGHGTVADNLESAAMDKFEQRMENEIVRLLGL